MADPCKYFINGKTLSREQFLSYVKTLPQNEIAEVTPLMKKKVGEFSSSHFDEKNILVHIRHNTRTDAEGNKVLFLEEVQSDWGQKGKKEGFEQKNNYEIKESELYDGNYSVYKNGVKVQDGFTKEGARNYVTQKASNESGIASAPFVTDTNAWVKLGLKVALKEAVKQGADKVAWTTGEQQNERYDLSKQLKTASASKNNDGTYQLVLEDKSGSEIEGYRGSGKRVTPKEMEDTIGKDISQKLIEGADKNKGKEWKKNMPVNPEFYTLSGDGLKIQGKGMKGFYGSPSENKLGIVGEVARSLFKQEPKLVKIVSGQKPQKFDLIDELILPDGYEYFKTTEYTWQVKKGDKVVGEGDTKSDARYDAIFKNNMPSTAKLDARILSSQHSITITPELKQEAETGLPLFKDIKGRGKEIANMLRKAKIKAGGLQSNIAGIPIAIYNAAIETIALALEGGATLTQSIQKAINKHKLNQQKNFNQKEFISKLEDATGEKFTEQTPPTPPPTEMITEDGEDGGGMNKKAVLNRLYNAKNVPEAAKEQFRKEKLDYVPSGQTEAAELAKSIIDEYGVDKAVRMAESSTLFSGDVRTLIFAESLNRLQGEDNAKKWAEVAISLDMFSRDSGRAISAINYFYKNNPYGVILKEEADRKDAFDAFSKNKEESWKEYIERIKDEPEFKDFVKQRVSEELKKERIAARAKRIKKVRDIFKKAKDSVKTNNTYATIIPPHILETAIEAMELLYEAGESVAHIISTGINHITDKLGNNNWDSEKFRGEWEEKLKDEQTKSELTDEEKKQKVLDKFRNKLKGLNDKQRDIVVRKMFDKVVKSGALEYEDLRNIIAETLGYGKLSEAESKKLKELVEKRNSVVDAAKKVQDEHTKESLTEYTKTQLEAGKAARELQDLLWNNPDVLKRMVSIMQLNTLGIPALINNPVYNFFNQLGVRFPVGLINTAADSVISGIAKLTGKNFVREYNIIAGQKEFWEKLGVGSKEAASQVLTGLNRMDYMQKEVYGNQIRPFRAWRDLMLSAQGKKNLSNKQIWDKALQAIPGIPAEIVARLLNVGDKPMRFASEGAQAAAFAKALNLKDIDKAIFIEFPREEAYRIYKGQGLSDEKAAQMADYVKEAIIKEGQRSTFQQDNLLNDVLTRAAGVFGGKDSGASTLAKTLVVSPYIKIPSNAFWSMYNLINPEIAMLQAIYHGAKASGFNKNGDIKNAKLQLREARYWAAHGVVGLGYKLLFISLVSAGVFVPSPDDESKKERSAQSLFELGGSVNIDKLLAILSFRDPSEVKDGTLVSNRWFGQVGAVGNIIARRWFDATPEQRENMTDFWNIALSGFELDALKEAENGVFANSSSLLQALGTGDFSRYGINTLNLFANIIQPASTAQLERSVINEVPQAKGDNFLDKVNQSFAQRSVLYRNLFNVKIDKKTSMWGEPIPKGGNFLTRMFGISKVNPQLDGRPMYDDYLRTSDAGFLPPDVQNKLNGAKLTNSQYNDLQRYVGNARKMYALPFINGDMQMVDGRAYSQLSDDEKKSMLSGLYDKGRKAGLEQFYTDYPEFRPKEETIQDKVKESYLKLSEKLIETKIKNKY